MTNTVLKSFMDTYGSRLFCINLDNSRFIYIGYTDGPKLTDITLTTIGGIDFIVVSRKDTSAGKDVPFETFHETSGVQWIGIMGEGYETVGVDPLLMR